MGQNSAFSAVKWVTISTFGKTALQFMQVVVLARLLTPADFGLVAIVITIVSFLQGLSDLGMSNGIIHHRDITQRELSSVYWLNLMMASALSLFIAVCSPFVSLFYNEPRLTIMLSLAGLTLIASAIGQQLRVKAERALNFKPLIFIELTCAAIAFVTTTLVAFYTKSASSLIIGLLLSNIILSILSWFFLSEGWRPIFTFNWADAQRFLSFGGYSSLSNIVGMINMQIDIVIGGRIFGATDLGAYSIARDLSLRLAGLTNPIATRVAFPLMAEVQNSKTHLKYVYVRMLKMLSAINFPLYMGICVFRTEIILILFGEQWLASAPLLCVLAIWGMIRSLINPVGTLLYASGRVKSAFRWNAILFIFAIPTVLIGSLGGAKGLGLAQLFFIAVVFVPAWRYLIQPSTDISLSCYFSIFYRPLLISIITVTICYLSVTLFSQPEVRLSAAVIIGFIVYMTLSWCFNRTWLVALVDIVRRPV